MQRCWSKVKHISNIACGIIPAYDQPKKIVRRKKPTMHLNIGLALPQTLLLVHVAGHLPQPPSPPLPPCASPWPPCRPSTPSLFTLFFLASSASSMVKCIYTLRSHPPGWEGRERERAAVHAPGLGLATESLSSCFMLQILISETALSLFSLHQKYKK